MKTLICLILSSLILSSCYKKRFPQTGSIDSVYVETIKEIPVYMPGDTVSVEIPAECKDQELVVLENEKLRYELTIEKGKIKTKYVIKPDTLKVYVPEIHEKIKEVLVPEKITYVPKFTSLTSKLGIILTLFIVAYIGFKIRFKGILNIFK